MNIAAHSADRQSHRVLEDLCELALLEDHGVVELVD